MKPFKFSIVLCIILSFTAAVTKAQENGTISYMNVAEVILPLYCGNVPVDRISDNWVEAHFRIHFEDGLIKWRILSLKGHVQSEGGITFEITALSMFRKWPVQEAHYNLKGDDGSHYVGSLTYNNDTDKFTFGKAICTGN